MPESSDWEERRVSEGLNKSDSSTPYGDLTVVDRDNRFDVASEYPLSEQNDIYTTGVTHDAAESRIRIRANASTESIETVEQLTYSPGYVAEVGMALHVPTAPTGDQEIRWGYWDGSDGVYFGWDSTGLYFEDMRGDTRQGKVRQSDWNGEGLQDIDPAQALQDGTITRLILGLYNYGGVEGQLFDKDADRKLIKPRTAHKFRPTGQTTLSAQNLPLRVEVANPAAADFDVYVADRQATIRGNFTPSRRLKGETRTAVSLSGTDWVPVLTIRKKAAFQNIEVGLFSANLKADTDLFIQFRSDAGSETDGDYATPSNNGADETAVEVDTTPTGAITDGFQRYPPTLVPGGTGSKESIGDLSGADVDLKRDRPFTMFARTTTGTGGNINALSFNWQETW